MIRNRRGYTMIEFIVMIAVASALTVGLGRAVQSQIGTALDNRDYMVALNLAKQQMAIMNASTTVPALATTAPSDVGVSFSGFTFSQVVTSVATNGSDYIRQIQLDVLKGSKVLVRVYTYRTNIVTFGNGT